MCWRQNNGSYDEDQGYKITLLCCFGYKLAIGGLRAMGIVMTVHA